MSPDTIFTIANLYVLPFWALLVFAPGWKGTHLAVHTFILPLALAAVYLLLAVTSFGSGEGDFNSLEGVGKLFANPSSLLAGWIHYLVFDLFVGAWEARDARRLKIPHLAVVPCLFLTLMLGPVGLLLYCILRMALRKEFSLEECPAAPVA